MLVTSLNASDALARVRSRALPCTSSALVRATAAALHQIRHAKHAVLDAANSATRRSVPYSTNQAATIAPPTTTVTALASRATQRNRDAILASSDTVDPAT